MSQIGVIMGSDSDYQVMEEALEVLQQFEVKFEVIISSAQRTLKRTVDWVKGGIYAPNQEVARLTYCGLYTLRMKVESEGR